MARRRPNWPAEKFLLLMVNKSQTARQPRFGLDQNSPLGRFWRWWSGELVALVPQWMRQSGNSAGNTLLIEIGTSAIVLWRWTPTGLVEQGRIDMQAGDQTSRSISFQALIGRLRKRDDRLALWLTGSQFLSKQIELPLAAVENLRQVLGFEMDRHTPFKADQVYFDFRVGKRDSQNSRITIKLIAAPRFAVDAGLDLLGRMGAPAQSVYVAGVAEGDDLVDLMPLERRAARSTALHLINLGAFVLAAMLALAAIVTPILQKRQVAISMIPMVENAKRQASSADELRRDWEKRSAEYNFALEKKQVAPPVVVQMDELSRLLPDDTWVQQFDIKGKEVQIQGETASSSKLIPLFESAKTLRDASFRSPVTKGTMPNSERFHLAAEIKPLPAGELAAAVQAAAVAAQALAAQPVAAVVAPPVVPAPVKAGAPVAVPQLPAKNEPAKASAASAGKPAQENNPAPVPTPAKAAQVTPPTPRAASPDLRSAPVSATPVPKTPPAVPAKPGGQG